MRVKKAIIPAAGLGTRVLPASKSTPKEMLHIVDRPAIQYIVEEAVNSGISEIMIITSRGKTTVEDHFDRSPELEGALLKKNDLKKYEEKIKEIINNTKSKFSSFIIQKAKQLINNRTFESKEEKNIFLNKLIKYINLKRAEKIIDENEKIKKKKKMILI